MATISACSCGSHVANGNCADFIGGSHGNGFFIDLRFRVRDCQCSTPHAPNLCMAPVLWAQALGGIQGVAQTVGLVGASLGPLPLGVAYD